MPTQISNKIRIIRENTRLSQERFGKKLGVSGKTISAYETGKCTPPLKVLENITQIYDVSFLNLKDTKRADLEKKMNHIKEIISDIEDILEKSLSF